MLGIKRHTRLSPLLEKCCLLLSANESYQKAEQDIEILTGRRVGHSTQQRLVHRQDLSPTSAQRPVEELSVDGGKVRLRTAQGKPCEYRDYKAIKLHQQVIAASFRDNRALIDWTNQQPLAERVSCLGDGHDGIWNIITEIGTTTQRREILDWYHLMENLAKVDTSRAQLIELEELLWEGKVEAAIIQLAECSASHAQQFMAYLQKHRHRLINYDDYWWRGQSIGSGEIESGIKQIAARVKLTGAQWNEENVPQVLNHRCAYLNGAFSMPSCSATTAAA